MDDTQQVTGYGMQILHTPQPGDGGVPLDIVAVHGLNGDPLKSWTHADATLWLRDMLPQMLKGARVMTFGYNASVVGDVSAYSVRAIAKDLLDAIQLERDEEDEKPRPIVFVAHSLGGIVTKQALTFANAGKEFSKYADIAKSTRGIVFFGTPHRGADAANWAGLVSDILQTAGAQPQSKLLHALQRHSTELWKISTDFRPLAPRYAITSFYESNAHPVLRRLVVGRMSAVMGLPHEHDVMMNGTHSTMCKFGRGDPRFDRAWKAIRRTAKGVQVVNN